MLIKKYFLVFASITVSIIALLYGVSPEWFVQIFFGITLLDINLIHILRAVMCLYLGLGGFWLFSAFSDKYRNPAILTTIIFAGGLVTGRFISLILDGMPSPILLLYVLLEFLLVPLAYWIFKLPE